MPRRPPAFRALFCSIPAAEGSAAGRRGSSPRLTDTGVGPASARGSGGRPSARVRPRGSARRLLVVRPPRWHSHSRRRRRGRGPRRRGSANPPARPLPASAPSISARGCVGQARSSPSHAPRSVCPRRASAAAVSLTRRMIRPRPAAEASDQARRKPRLLTGADDGCHRNVRLRARSQPRTVSCQRSFPVQPAQEEENREHSAWRDGTGFRG